MTVVTQPVSCLIDNMALLGLGVLAAVSAPQIDHIVLLMEENRCPLECLGTHVLIDSELLHLRSLQSIRPHVRVLQRGERSHRIRVQPSMFCSLLFAGPFVPGTSVSSDSLVNSGVGLFIVLTI